MTRVELKENAKKQIQGNIWMLFLVTLIVAGIMVVCSYIPFIGWIGGILLGPALTIGMIMVYFKVAKGEEFKVGDVFEGCHLMGKALVLDILISIFTALWSLLLVIPGIIKYFSYSMAPYILADNPDMTASEALKESIRIMDGHKMDLFILQLSFIGWILLVSITFGIASIYVFPYMQTTFVNFYNSIKEPKNDESKNEEPTPEVIQ